MPGLRTFPGISGKGCNVPSTQQALWIFFRDDDRGRLFDRTRQITLVLDDAFVLDDAMDTFKYAGGRDLTGYEDGTENPKGNAALHAAVVRAAGTMRGSSFVAVQRWLHDLRRFGGYTPRRRDDTIGRALKTNAEIEDAPASAHVKRTAQESFEPEAFMLRHSMPWATAFEHGLEFIAFAESLDRYERVLRRMAGLEDGITDALFTFSRPVTGGYYWCPPVAGKQLDLRQLAL